jgi:hypothetical protein
MKWLCCVFQFGLENDSHDNAIDGHCLTENNTASWPDISKWEPKNFRDQRPWWFLKQWQIPSHWRRTSLDLPAKQNCITHKNKKYLMRFFEVMRGALIAAPMRVLPVM